MSERGHTVFEKQSTAVRLGLSSALEGQSPSTTRDDAKPIWEGGLRLQVTLLPAMAAGRNTARQWRASTIRKARRSG